VVAALSRYITGYSRSGKQQTSLPPARINAQCKRAARPLPVRSFNRAAYSLFRKQRPRLVRLRGISHIYSKAVHIALLITFWEVKKLPALFYAAQKKS